MLFGECEISINEEEEPRKVQGGSTLLASLKEHEIFIPSACGGRGSCGLCKVKVLDGGGPLLPTETPHLSKDEIENQIRVSCQIKVRSDIVVEIPEEILTLREYRTLVEKIVDLNYDTKLIRLKLVEPAEISFKPGQYVQLETPPYGKTPEPVYRAYSIGSSPSENTAIELIIRLVPNGICTTFVFDVLKEGDSITMNGPYGDFYLRDTDTEIVFIAGGSGIAPIRSILYRMAEEGSPRKSSFFYGANELRDLYLVEEMKAFEKRIPNFAYVPSIARPVPDEDWQGESGLVTEVVGRYVKDGSSIEAYLCGSPGMIDASIKSLKSKGVTDGHIFYDKFA